MYNMVEFGTSQETFRTAGLTTRDVHFGPKFSIFWGRILLPCKFVKTELVLSFLKLTV